MTRLTRSLLSLRRLLPGQGRADAPRVWLALWSHVRWRRKRGETWIGDRLLAEETGLDVRRVQRALLLLERSGLLTRSWGRPQGARKPRRIIELAPGIGRDRQPKICPPPAEAAEHLRLDVAELRERPSATISTFWAIYVCAQAHGGRESHVTMVALQDITGSRSAAAFYGQLEDLARAGLIEKVGAGWADGIRVLRYVPQALATIAPRTRVAEARMPKLPPGRMIRRPAQPPPVVWVEDRDPAVWEAVA